MKYRLSHLLLVMALVGMGLGWWLDHVRLSRANARLNAEAAELFLRWTASQHSGGFTSLDFPDGRLPEARTYDFTKPEDRAAYLEAYGHLRLW
jgi:hypothetical protein